MADVVSPKNESQGLAQHVEKYITPDENVNAVSSGNSRTFAVTDRRVLDIQESETNHNKLVENISTTLFTNISRANISIEGSTRNTDTSQIIGGVLLGLIGVVAMIFGLSGGGSGTLIGVLVGAVLIVLTGWLLLNATEQISGGIRVELHHGTPNSGPPDRYILPEDQDETARAVVRNIGRKHAPSAQAASVGVANE